jgi:hypothetical protein
VILFVAEETKGELKCKRRSPLKDRRIPFILSVLLVCDFSSICSSPLPLGDPAIRSRRDANADYREHRRDRDAYAEAESHLRWLEIRRSAAIAGDLAAEFPGTISE